MDLGGVWRVAATTEGLRRTFHEIDYDDSGWAPMPVPSHWGQSADLAGEEEVLYRRRFEGPEEPCGARVRRSTDNLEGPRPHQPTTDSGTDPSASARRPPDDPDNSDNPDDPGRPAADADSDADTDTATDTNTNTAADTDTDTPADTNTNTPADTNTNTDTPADTAADTSSASPRNRCSVSTNTDTNTDTAIDTRLRQTPRRRGMTNTDTAIDTPADTAANTDTDTPADTNTGADTNTNTPTNTNIDTDTPADTNTGAGAGRRWWLRLEGIAQQGDVWLDGAYLGHTDGYFVPHELEVTEQIGARREHLLAIDATCRRFDDPDNRTTLTGALQDPELCGSDGLIVGGVWQPVRLRSSGPMAIRHARVVCAWVGPPPGSRRARSTGGRRARARLALRAVLDAPVGGEVCLRTRVAGTEHLHRHPAAAGENRVEWTVDVDDPPLWWPHALGDQPLCDLTLDAMCGGEVHDRRRLRIGFRSVEMRRWVLHVNGERLFVKGANLLPVRPLPGTASPSEAAADVRAARKAGLDMVRPVAHIARRELYDAADELGMLVWQDLPVRGVMSRSVAAEARRQAREAVDLLGHHPSVALWCAHDDPFPRPRRASATPRALSRLGPSWNRDVLDLRLSRVLSRCDGSRPVVAHTAVPPHLPSLEGTTSQFWFGLHGGRAADLAPKLARVPAMGRFVSAFGTPVAEDQPEVLKTTIEILRRLKYRPTGGFLLHALADPGTNPNELGPPNTEIAQTQAGEGPTDTAPEAKTKTAQTQPGPADTRTQPGPPNTAQTQAGEGPTNTAPEAEAEPANTQAEAKPAGTRTEAKTETAHTHTGTHTKTHAEAAHTEAEPANTRTQPGPANTVDRASSEPAGVGFGVLDSLRRPKPGWQALLEACRPLIAVADPLPETVRGGDRLHLSVHVINDTRQDIDGMLLRARVLDSAGALVSEQRWSGSAPADDCVAVGRIDAQVPSGRPGKLTVELTLTPGRSPTDATPAPAITNRHQTTVV